ALESEEDLARLQRICSHVWVDTQRGKAPELRYMEFDQAAASVPPDEFARLRKTRWAIKSDFADEMREAGKANAELEAGIAEVMRDLQEGKRLDVQRLKHGVEAMIDSILRNPNAFIWLREM